MSFTPQYPHPSTGSSSQADVTTHSPRPNDQRTSSRQPYGPTAPVYNTRTGEIDGYRQQQYSHGAGIGRSMSGADGRTNYTTEPYGSPSPQSYPSAHASMTTGSGGSPHLQQSYQSQTSYPFTPSSPRQSHQTTSSGATGHPSQYPGPRRSVNSLPVDVQSTIQSKDRRYIQTNLNESSITSSLTQVSDAIRSYINICLRMIGYRRVAQPSRGAFFVSGRVSTTH